MNQLRRRSAICLATFALLVGCTSTDDRESESTEPAAASPATTPGGLPVVDERLLAHDPLLQDLALKSERIPDEDWLAPIGWANYVEVDTQQRVIETGDGEYNQLWLFLTAWHGDAQPVVWTMEFQPGYENELDGLQTTCGGADGELIRIDRSAGTSRFVVDGFPAIFEGRWIHGEEGCHTSHTGLLDLVDEEFTLVRRDDKSLAIVDLVGATRYFAWQPLPLDD